MKVRLWRFYLVRHKTKHHMFYIHFERIYSNDREKYENNFFIRFVLNYTCVVVIVKKHTLKIYMCIRYSDEMHTINVFVCYVICVFNYILF